MRDMKNKLKTYQENVKQIFYRDYIIENEKSERIIESVLQKVELQKYMKKGYSEEAVAQEIYAKELIKYKEESG